MSNIKNINNIQKLFKNYRTFLDPPPKMALFLVYFQILGDKTILVSAVLKG